MAGTQEICFNVCVTDPSVTQEAIYTDPRLAYCFRETFDPTNYTTKSQLDGPVRAAARPPWPPTHCCLRRVGRRGNRGAQR